MKTIISHNYSNSSGRSHIASHFDDVYYDRIWSSGVELQSVVAAVEFDSISGSPTVDTTLKRTGAGFSTS
jgi:hypothetical protein